MSKPMSMRFAAKYYNGEQMAREATAWTNYADWQAEKLFPLVEKLMTHKDQPYSGNLLLSMKQACIRLGAGNNECDYVDMAYAEILATIARINAEHERQHGKPFVYDNGNACCSDGNTLIANAEVL